MKHITPQPDQDELDSARLYDKIDRLAPLTKKYAKKMGTALEFGVCDVTAYHRSPNDLSHIGSSST